MGGPTQRYARLGTRYSYAVDARPLSVEQGMSVVSALAQGVEAKVRHTVRQEFAVGSPGSPTYSSGSGRVINATGFTAGYKIKSGQFFSLLSGGVYYLHMVTADVTATGGAAVLPIFPMLRVVPSAGSALHFAAPQIEGFLSGTSQSWNVRLAKAIGLSFTITEAA